LIFALNHANLFMTQCVIVRLIGQLMDKFIAKNGQEIRAREMLPEDAPYLVDLFEHMGVDSRYRRFNQTLDRVEIDRIWLEAEHIAQAAAANTYGLIAFTDFPERPGVPVAGARFVKLTSTEAEIATSVRDDMQSLGIGSWLTELLVKEAKRQGIKVLVGSVQNDNQPVWAILKKLGYTMSRQPDGNTTLATIYLDRPDTTGELSPEAELEWHKP
jgi:GNAT superfamily N-acetyltransferase